MSTKLGEPHTLAFDNTDWDPMAEHNFRRSFREAFDVPLNRPIDPTKMTMGQEGVYGYLLEIKSVDQVLPYQKDSFDELRSKGVIRVKAETVRVCRNSKCISFRKVETDLTRASCVKCDATLKSQQVQSVYRDPKRIQQVLADLMKQAGWTLGDEERQFEGARYYPLTRTDVSGFRQTSAVVFRSTLDDKQRTKLERSSRALVVVKTRTAERAVYPDSTGVGTVSLAYLLAAEGEDASRAEAVGRLKTLLDDLQRDLNRRVHQSAHRSYQDLRDRSGITDKEFETDVFNVLRALFPETIKLGREGKTEPDGFSAVPWFEDGSLRDGRLWAWSYDAKLAITSKPYDLSSDEYRKIRDYINKLRDSRALFSKSKRLMAHVLVSNNIEPSRMKVAAAYLAGSGGVKPDNKEVVLVLMPIEFLLRLYERVRDAEDRFRRRWPHFATELRTAMMQKNADGYAHLTRLVADQLADRVLAYEEVHPIVVEDTLKASLDNS